MKRKWKNKNIYFITKNGNIRLFFAHACHLIVNTVQSGLCSFILKYGCYPDSPCYMRPSFHSDGLKYSCERLQLAIVCSGLNVRIQICVPSLILVNTIASLTISIVLNLLINITTRLCSIPIWSQKLIIWNRLQEIRSSIVSCHFI